MSYKNNYPLAAGALLLASLSGSIPLAQAANLTWDITGGDGATISDGAGTWDTVITNWNNGSTNVAFVTNDDVTFGTGSSLGASYTVALGAATTTVGSLNFNYTGTNSYTIGATANSQTIAFNGGSGLINVSGAPTNNAVINAVVAGNFSVTGTGNKGVILLGNGTQTSANTVTVAASTLLQVGNNSATGNLGSANITNNGILTYRRSGTLNMNNVISGSGAVNYQIRAATVTLNTASTYTGATQVGPTGASAGASTINWNTTDALPTGTALTILTATASSTTLDLKGFNQTIASLTGAGTTTDSIITSSSGTPTLTIGGSTTTAFGGLLSGSLALARSGTGTQTLTGANTYTGGTNVTGGTLATGATGSFGSNSISVSSGAILTLGNNASIGDTANLTFGNTSTINLSFVGSETLGALGNSVSSTYISTGTYTAAQLNSFFGGSVFTGAGSLNVTSAIPEPSTFAALAGAGILGFVFYRRRRA